ncbi:glycosyltransferase [Winogradskya consettensis]|uniref:4,4'-diaponeurosporenoate glycosyltransferase n=1 Tax=Winogradskya consettensis TaxID=113560 RepID=A0A919VNH4_9ACTN|nr:glycosyltransferase [Actinoplanes consettensis]GIM72774.1 glycosyl transferase [Actinoplanes consettensis]
MTRLAVVVPAHDEEALLPACLDALAVAAAAVPVPVEIVVVADACTDRTEAIAAAAGAEVVPLSVRNVGRARNAGMAHALRQGPETLWLATTDADSRVRPDWLVWHLDHARAGADLVAGTVRVDDWTCWPAGLPEHYEEHYRRAAGAHVHGANLGIAAATYVAAGGFPALTHDEDQVLLRRARALRARIVMDPACPVHTSARRLARAPLGFAAHLALLEVGL